MRILSDISIKKKLTILTMLSVLTALVLACTAFVVNDYFLIRRNLEQHLTTLVEVLGENAIASIQFHDKESAEQLLSSLKLEPTVEGAVLYDPAGEVFAGFSRGNTSFISFSPGDGSAVSYQGNSIQVARRIEMNNEWIGTLYLQGDLSFIWRELKRYLFIGVVVVALSMLAAGILGSKLQRIISQPILELTQTAKRVIQNNDYSLRVVRYGNDELGELCIEFNSMMDKIVVSDSELREAHYDLEGRVEERTNQLTDSIEKLHKEILERERAEKELEQVHREFVDAARKAGMAEVAIGVLHNVGNVLNSVNTSVSILSSKIQNSKSSRLVSVVELLEQHEDDLASFLTRDEKGKQVPKFLKLLAEHTIQEEKALLHETEQLMEHVEHVKQIISTQQSLAKSGGLVEEVCLNGFLEDAVKLNASSFERHDIHVLEEYCHDLKIAVDKHKVLQIVINLMKNAKESLLLRPPGDRTLTLRTHSDDGFAYLEVSDTGIGIDKENLERIFAYGYTTKKDGHGFGLHSCANAAVEMGGNLTATSEGVGKGASFVLKLPLGTAAAGKNPQAELSSYI